MTLGELRERLADLPDETILMMGGVSSAADIDGWILDFVASLHERPPILRFLTKSEVAEEEAKSQCPCGGNCRCGN